MEQTTHNLNESLSYYEKFEISVHYASETRNLDIYEQVV